MIMQICLNSKECQVAWAECQEWAVCQEWAECQVAWVECQECPPVLAVVAPRNVNVQPRKKRASENSEREPVWWFFGELNSSA